MIAILLLLPSLCYVVCHPLMVPRKVEEPSRYDLTRPIVPSHLPRTSDELGDELVRPLIEDGHNPGVAQLVDFRAVGVSLVYHYRLDGGPIADPLDECFPLLSLFVVVPACHVVDLSFFFLTLV